MKGNAMGTERLCSNCKYSKFSTETEPCLSCFYDIITDRPKWEMKNETESTGESVNHPAHYCQGKFECIDVMVETFGEEATKGFCLLNAFKYIWRTGEKNGVEDVKKARWYLDKYLELEGETDE